MNKHAKYFLKLASTFDPALVNLSAHSLQPLAVYNQRQLCGQRAVSQFKNYEDVPATTFVAPTIIKEQLLRYLPKELLRLELPELWVMNITPESANSYLPAHRDKTRLCSVNFYMDTHSEETAYYQLERRRLIRMGSFVAHSGEIWVLNSDEIHDVKLSYPYTRKSLGFSFLSTPFDTVRGIYERSMSLES